MIFSKRIGKQSSTKDLQLESIDDELKNGLWNVILLEIIEPLAEPDSYTHRNDLKSFSKFLWHELYKLPIDEIPWNDNQIISFIRDRFFNFDWFNSYDLIDLLLNTSGLESKRESFANSINKILEREFSGYRIINYQVAPISNEYELKEVLESIELTKQFTALDGANIHLKRALEFISDRKNPDYSNSIKESISAVEATCRIITNESTLGKSLKKLESNGVEINGQLKQGFEKIYAYTNDKNNGIRHAMVDIPMKPDFSDAKYMLISCSAFINYLISKAEQNKTK